MLIGVKHARPSDAPIVAEMVGELLHEIMAAIGWPVFGFDATATQNRAKDWMTDGKSRIWLASDRAQRTLGFVALYEGYALYAEGTFGTISELYVRPAFRSQGVGAALLDEVKRAALARGWTRLEVTTPPLPQFDRTLAFYTRHGFTISGGRKLKATL